MSRHKWNGKPRGEASGYRGGMEVACVKCGCVKGIIGGRVTYFLNDNVTDYAPKCEDKSCQEIPPNPTMNPVYHNQSKNKR